MDINLLPQELKPNKTVLKTAKQLSKTTWIISAILSLVLLAVGGVYYYYSKKTQDSVTKQTELRSKIRALEDTEQRLVLIKDRIGKIIKINSNGTIAEETGVVEKVLAVLPEDAVIGNIAIDRDLVRLSVSTTNLTSAGKYISTVTNIPGVKYVNLISFDFSPNNGYTVDINFIPGTEVEPSIN